MTPSWYDLLDIEQDATTDQIRAAWRDKVADLDPTDRRFAVLNRAAKVLLDTEDRAAYDAELAAARAAEDADEGEAETAVEPTPDAVVAPAPPVRKEPAPAEPAEATAPEPRTGSLTVAILAGVLALAFAVIAVVPLVFSQDESDVEAGIADARAAAEQAIVPILSYDADDLEAGRSSATSFMTDGFREDYESLFDGLVADNAQSLGIAVRGQLLASAVVRADGDRVQVLVFADQTRTTADSAQPQVSSNQVTVTMERVADRWLVDDLDVGTAG